MGSKRTEDGNRFGLYWEVVSGDNVGVKKVLNDKNLGPPSPLRDYGGQVSSA